MYAEGIHYVVLSLNIVFRSKYVFDTEYQDFMKCFYVTPIWGKHDTEPSFLIVVFPCMLIITQLLFQQNALVY
jgi:hypothetical protein